MEQNGKKLISGKFISLRVSCMRRFLGKCV